MSELTDKIIASRDNSEIETCILWVLDDAYEDQYTGRLINPHALKHAEEAAAELAALQSRVKTLEKVLRPFADIPCLENFDDDQLFDPAGGVCAGDVRQARAALDTQA